MKKILLITLLFLFGCQSTREEITERHTDGSKKLVVKYKGDGSKEVIVGRLYYDEDGYEYNKVTYNSNNKIDIVKGKDKNGIERLIIFSNYPRILTSNILINGEPYESILYDSYGEKLTKFIYKDGETVTIDCYGNNNCN